MRLVASRSSLGAFARLVAAAVLVAVVAVGAPLHAHDLVPSGSDTLQKSSCAACVVSASPALVLEQVDAVPRFEALDVVSVDEPEVAALSFAVRPGRAPPVV